MNAQRIKLVWIVGYEDIHRYEEIGWLDGNKMYFLVFEYIIDWETISMGLHKNLHWKIFLIKKMVIWNELHGGKLILLILHAYNAVKRTYRKNVVCPRNLLATRKGKKMQKIRSCYRCSIVEWYDFWMLLVVAS